MEMFCCAKTNYSFLLIFFPTRITKQYLFASYCKSAQTEDSFIIWRKGHLGTRVIRDTFVARLYENTAMMQQRTLTLTWHGVDQGESVYMELFRSSRVVGLPHIE